MTCIIFDYIYHLEYFSGLVRAYFLRYVNVKEYDGYEFALNVSFSKKTERVVFAWCIWSTAMCVFAREMKCLFPLVSF